MKQKKYSTQLYLEIMSLCKRTVLHSSTPNPEATADLPNHSQHLQKSSNRGTVFNALSLYVNKIKSWVTVLIHTYRGLLFRFWRLWNCFDYPTLSYTYVCIQSQGEGRGKAL